MAISDVICVSLSRNDLTKVLGKHVQEAVLQNVVRWAFKGSEVLKQYSAVQIERLLKLFQFFNYHKGNEVYAKGKVEDLIIVLEGRIQADKVYNKGK
jgi:hypothetical protein